MCFSVANMALSRSLLHVKLGYPTLALLSITVAIILIPKWRKTVKCYLKYGMFFTYTSFASMIGIVVALRAPFTHKSLLIFTKLLDPISNILGIDWEFRNTENVIESGKSAVFVSNHQTLFDILGMARLWNRKSIQCTVIARNLFFWVWPLGLAMWLGGIVFIKRNSATKDAVNHVNRVAETIFKRKVKLWVYAEGTRNTNTETLLPFKKGAFIMAITHQIPIIPVVYSPYYFVSWKDKYFNTGKVIVQVLEPICTTGLTLENVDNLIEKTHAIMSKERENLRNEINEFITGNNVNSKI